MSIENIRKNRKIKMEAEMIFEKMGENDFKVAKDRRGYFGDNSSVTENLVRRFLEMDKLKVVAIFDDERTLYNFTIVDAQKSILKDDSVIEREDEAESDSEVDELTDYLIALSRRIERLESEKYKEKTVHNVTINTLVKENACVNTLAKTIMRNLKGVK